MVFNLLFLFIFLTYILYNIKILSLLRLPIPPRPRLVCGAILHGFRARSTQGRSPTTQRNITDQSG
jgi:hypothetical protein